MRLSSVSCASAAPSTRPGHAWRSAASSWCRDRPHPTARGVSSVSMRPARSSADIARLGAAPCSAALRPAGLAACAQRVPASARGSAARPKRAHPAPAGRSAAVSRPAQAETTQMRCAQAAHGGARRRGQQGERTGRRGGQRCAPQASAARASPAPRARDSQQRSRRAAQDGRRAGVWPRGRARAADVSASSFAPIPALLVRIAARRRREGCCCVLRARSRAPSCTCVQAPLQGGRRLCCCAALARAVCSSARWLRLASTLSSRCQGRLKSYITSAIMSAAFRNCALRWPQHRSSARKTVSSWRP